MDGRWREKKKAAQSCYKIPTLFSVLILHTPLFFLSLSFHTTLFLYCCTICHPAIGGWWHLSASGLLFLLFFSYFFFASVIALCTAKYGLMMTGRLRNAESFKWPNRFPPDWCASVRNTKTIRLHLLFLSLFLIFFFFSSCLFCPLLLLFFPLRLTRWSKPQIGCIFSLWLGCSWAAKWTDDRSWESGCRAICFLNKTKEKSISTISIQQEQQQQQQHMMLRREKAAIERQASHPAQEDAPSFPLSVWMSCRSSRSRSTVRLFIPCRCSCDH